MFHHFPELGEIPCPTQSTEITVEADPVAARIIEITQVAYRRNDDDTLARAEFPPLTFTWSTPAVDPRIHTLDTESIENLPRGVDGGSYQWIDFEGDGLNGVLCRHQHAWYYKRNLGEGAVGAETTGRVPAVDRQCSGQPSAVDGSGRERSSEPCGVVTRTERFL